MLETLWKPWIGLIHDRQETGFPGLLVGHLLIYASLYWILRTLLQTYQERTQPKTQENAEKWRKTLRRKRAWLLTFCSSLQMSLVGLGQLLDFYQESGLQLKHHWLHDGEDVWPFAAFSAYLILDLFIGYVDYREQLGTLTGYVHHTFYLHLLITLLHHRLTTPFLLFFIHEVPTLIMALSQILTTSTTRSSKWDWTFGFTYLLFRIIYHTWMVYQFYYFFPVQGGWYWFVVVTYGLHVHWFWCWVKSMQKRLKKLNVESTEQVALRESRGPALQEEKRLDKEEMAFQSRSGAKWPMRSQKSEDSGVLLVEDDDDDLQDVDSGSADSLSFRRDSVDSQDADDSTLDDATSASKSKTSVRRRK